MLLVWWANEITLHFVCSTDWLWKVHLQICLPCAVRDWKFFSHSLPAPTDSDSIGERSMKWRYCLTRIDCHQIQKNCHFPKRKKYEKIMAMVCYASGQSMQDSSLRIPNTDGKLFRFLRFLQQTHFKNVCWQACGHFWTRLKPATRTLSSDSLANSRSPTISCNKSTYVPSLSVKSVKFIKFWWRPSYL